MERWHLGHNGGGVENIVHFDESTGELWCGDYQSLAVNQAIVDENKLWRDTERHDRANCHGAPGVAQGRKIASIPITLWQHWRNQWKAHHADKWTWQTFELMKLALPENAELLTTGKPI